MDDRPQDETGSSELTQEIKNIPKDGYPTEPKLGAVVNKPHRITIVMSCGALTISFLSFVLSSWQFWENLKDRSKPSVQRVIEKPRMSFQEVKSTGLEKVVARTVYPPGESLPLGAPEYYVAFHIRFRNTGRTAAAPVKHYYSSVLKRTYSGSELPFSAGGEQACSPDEHMISDVGVKDIAPNESIDLMVSSIQLSADTVADLRKRKKSLVFCGVLEYRDAFGEVLRSGWMAVAMGGSRGFDVYVPYAIQSP